MAEDPHTDERIALAFQARYCQDRAQGCEHDLAHYLRLYPGHEETIRREYLGQTVAHDAAGDAGATPDVELKDVGPYRILSELGRGGQGVVYLAEDTRLERRVAVKVLPALGAGVAHEALQRFHREALVASRLDHPGICPVYDVGTSDEVPFIAMRYVEGQSLARLIGRMRQEDTTASGPVSLDASDVEPVTEAGSGSSQRPAQARSATLRVVALGERVARALHVAHEAGVVHRDIKPGNVMVGHEAEPVILDFGMARMEDGELSALTLSGQMHGTPSYMSPEQLTEGAQIDRRTDVYSLGVTLYECLTLHRPHEAPTRAALFDAILRRAPSDPRRYQPGLPLDLKVILETALEKDPEHRYQSAEALADDLRALREGRPVSVKPLSMVARSVRWVRREPLKAALLALVLVCAGMLGYLSARWSDLRLGAAERLRVVVEEQLQEGYFELGDGSAKAAREAFERALGEDRQAREAVVGLALAHLRLKDYAAALATLDAHRDLAASEPALQLIRADVLRALDRDDEATAIEAAAQEPDTALGHFLLGTRAMQKGERGDEKAFEVALVHITRAILETRQQRALYLFERAHAAGHCRDAQAGGETAKVLAANWPDSAIAWYFAGFAQRSTARAEAIVAFEKAIALRPDRAKFHAQLAAVLASSRRLDDAIAAYEKALELRPWSANALRGYALTLHRKKRLDEALVVVEKAIKRDPDSAYAHHVKGMILARKKKRKEAIAAYRESLRLNPDLQVAHVNLGAMLNDERRFEEALVHHRKAIELKPDHAIAHANLGVALAELGDLANAAAAYEKALKLKPRAWLTHYNFANVLSRLDRLEEAVAAYRRSVKINPKFFYAFTFMGELERKLGLVDQAIKDLREAKKLRPEYAPARCFLGLALRDSGEYEDALAELEEGHRLGTSGSGWGYPSGQWVAEVKRLRDLERR